MDEFGVAGRQVIGQGLGGLFDEMCDDLTAILTPFNIENYTKSKDIGFEPIQWKYECQGLHVSKMGC